MQSVDDLRKAEAKFAAIIGDTEDSLALVFSTAHARDLRYVARWNKWYRWNGKVWAEDDTLSVFDSIREMVRSTGEKKFINAKTVAAVERLARCDRRQAATIDQWNPDQCAINPPAGIVDLRTGKAKPHDPRAYCTKITAIAPDGDCPLWAKFLREVTRDDSELIAFLKRLCGYALTGSTREHMLAFFWGTGRNGKGVFLNTLHDVLGDYSTIAGMETFTESRHDRHPTELAALLDARLAISQETEEGRHWAETRIKALTGGDSISARFMRQDFFTFTPKFTLLVAGNHKPRIKNIDEAMRSRLYLVPFTVTIPKQKRDPNLREELRTEWPGILQWMIDGCLEYQRIGLAAPQTVLTATAEYFDSEDSFAQWLEDETERGATFWEAPGRLFASWKRYATASNENPGTEKSFAERMKGADFEKGNSRAKGGRFWAGLKLRLEPEKFDRWGDLN